MLLIAGVCVALCRARQPPRFAAVEQLAVAECLPRMAETGSLAIARCKFFDHPLLTLAVDVREQNCLPPGIGARRRGAKEAGLDEHILQVGHERLEYRLLSRQRDVRRGDQDLRRP